MDLTRKLEYDITEGKLPQHIFKYRACNLHTEKIVTHNELWFSDPLLFNDPYDCNTPITTASSQADITQWLQGLNPLPNNIQQLATDLFNKPSLMKEKTLAAMSRLGICCFSAIDNSILQWSHYADYHKGICLKFAIQEDMKFFLIPVKVAYTNLLPHYNHFIHKKEIVERLIQPKFDKWSYESEIRIVKYKLGIANTAGNQAYMYKDSALIEIIFGVKTPTATIERYKQLCASHNKGHVQFSQMELGTGTHYELIKKSI